jgi:hypothetical protein
MKKSRFMFVLSVLLVLLAVLVPVLVLAVTPNTVPVTVPIAGVATWTNATEYYAFKLTSIEAFQAGEAASTCTVTRIRSGRTNTVATVDIASSAGVYYLTNTIYLFKGDKLKFTMNPLTNVLIEITGEQLP